MAVVQVSTAPSRELYERVTDLIGLEGDLPDGLIVHTASELPSGEVQIIDVYESAEQLQAFGQNRLFPAFEKAGVMDRVLAQGPPSPHEPFHFLTR